MKKRLTGYTFDASEKTVVHADFSDITLEGIQLIVNTTDNIIIYNFADATKGGTLSTDTLTLTYDTTSMSDTDKLMILVDDAVTTQTVAGTVTANLSATDNAVLDAIELATEATQTAVESILAGQLPDSHNVTVDNASIAVTNAALTELAAAINSDKVDVNIASGSVTVDPTGLATDTNQDEQTALLTTIDTDTGNIATSVSTIAAAVKAEDSQHSSTDSGVHILAVRKDSSSALATTDGDYIPLTTDSNGKLWTRGVMAQDGGWTVALGAGSQTIGKLGANSGVDIGDVDVTSLPALAAGTNNIGDVDVFSNTAKDGSGTRYQPLVDTDGHLQIDVLSGGGGGTQYTEGDTDASITGTAMLWEDGSDTLRAVSASKPLPVDLQDASVAVTNADITTIAGAVSGTEMQVDVVTSTLPTGASTLAEQQSQTTHLATIAGDTTDIETAVELIDDTVYTDGTGTVTKGIAVLGQDGTNPQAIKTDSNGELQVDVLTMPTVAVTQSGTWDEVGINDSGNSITVDDGGSSLTVDYATTGSGTATGALRVELPTNGTGVIATVGAVTAITNALPAGTNAIGKLAANSGVDIGDVDVTSLPALAAGTNAIGKVLPTDIDVTAHSNYARKYYTSTGAATDGIVWSPAAGKRWHVTSLYFQVSADATVTFEDDKSGGDDPVLKGEFKAGSGLALSFDEKYPFASGEDAADLIVTTSAGNIYVSVVGYEV